VRCSSEARLSRRGYCTLIDHPAMPSDRSAGPVLHGQKVVIVGAGPTGLGAAHRLAELGHEGFTVYEQSPHAGGLAASFRDAQGFTWDVGGHVQFSHYHYFDRVMDSLLGDEWLQHQRESWVWMRDRFIPYPFQNNIHYLPLEEKKRCLLGLVALLSGNHASPPANFAEWLTRSFGEGIADIFLLPYNFKVWAYPPSDLSFHWVGERVATVDMKRVLSNLLEDKPDLGWGPNNTFRFPLNGGTGEIWRRLAARLPAGVVHYGKRVRAVRTAARRIDFTDGTSEAYDALISTMPLDMLVCMSDLDASAKSAVREMKFSTVHIVGIGLKGAPPPHLKTKCWMYFPESNCPFYRATLFSNYSPRNVPDASRFWSLMLEVSESPVKHVDRDAVVDSVVDGLLASRLISSANDICDTWQYTAGHGYPTPFLGRDQITGPVNARLEERSVFSRGRFGAWKYEVSNQDHSFMQGVELVNRLGFAEPEMTINHPSVVNAAKN
jgi:protoporphyrinogen oxidase